MIDDLARRHGLTPAQRRAVDVLIRNGGEAQLGTKTQGEPPTVWWHVAVPLRAMGLVRVVGRRVYLVDDVPRET